jgi:glyoxylase-like metal-dependent hydrolase (beta-lactamase superfamily II)
MVVNILKHCNGQIIEWQWAMDSDLIPTPFFTSVYVIDGLLIDTAAPASDQELLEFLRSLPKDKKVSKCLITHIHEDHAGGARLLKEELDIPIYASKEAVEYFKKGNEYPQYRKMTWGEKLLPFEAIPVGKKLESASGNYQFEMFRMPGHSPDLIAPLEKEKEWVFTTDAVQKKYKMIFGHESDIQEDMSLIYDSIKKLYQYTESMDNLKIFISGDQKTYNRKLLKEKIDEIEEKHQKVHDLYDKFEKKGLKKDKILKKILKEFFGRESVVGKLTKGDLSNMNLIKSFLNWPIKEQE